MSRPAAGLRRREGLGFGIGGEVDSSGLTFYVSRLPAKPGTTHWRVL